MNLPLSLTLSLYADSLRQIEEMLSNVPDEAMARQFPGVVNHPAWTIGHLCTSSAFVLFLLEEKLDASLQLEREKYGPGSVPNSTRSNYPSKQQLLAELRSMHTQVAKAVEAKHDAYFAKQAPEAVRSFFPTIGRGVMYLIACHEPYHQGQLAQWKKAAGIASK